MSWLLGVLLVLGAATPAWSQGTPGDLASAVEALARGKDTQARMAAAKQLGGLRNPRALEPLVAALADANRDVRWAAVEALGELGDRGAIPALIEYVKKPEAYRWGKRLVAGALAAIGDARAVQPLVGLLDDEDPFVRRIAALALVRIGDPAGLPRVAQLVKETSDPTLAGVRREFARSEESRLRQVARSRPPEVSAGGLSPLRPREWGGFKVGVTRQAEVRQGLGSPLQDAPEFALYRGDRLVGPLRADSVVVNADTAGLIDSMFIFPVWGTTDRDVRAVLGRGTLTTYGEFLKSTGKTVSGAGTRADTKLHYVPPETITEAYPQMGVLVVYDGGEPAPDRLVKLIIVH